MYKIGEKWVKCVGAEEENMFRIVNSENVNPSPKKRNKSQEILLKKWIYLWIQMHINKVVTYSLDF